MKSLGAVAVAACVAVLGAGPARADEGRWAVSASGGVAGYSGALGSQVKPGGTWGLQVERSVASNLRLGIAYLGGANEVRGAFAGPPPVLQRDGGALSLKAIAEDGRWVPFFEAGAGVSRFHVRQGDPASAVHGATALSVPLSLGLQANAGVLRAGVRVGYELLLAGNPTAGGRGNQLGAALELGARF